MLFYDIVSIVITPQQESREGADVSITNGWVSLQGLQCLYALHIVRVHGSQILVRLPRFQCFP